MIQEGQLNKTEAGEIDEGITMDDLKLLFHGDGNQILSKVSLLLRV
jgi:hypothetical protein